MIPLLCALVIGLVAGWLESEGEHYAAVVAVVLGAVVLIVWVA